MNEATPRRYAGSLLERAADLYDLGMAPAFPPVPEPAIEHVQPVPVPEPEARAAPPEPKPESPRAEDVVRTPVRPRLSHGRRTAPIDREMLGEKGMIVPGAPITPLAEEFRLVKRQLIVTARDIADESRARMILVGSARPDDGKTFCAVNLALSMAAERDVEILLVDADFAKPDVLETLGVEEGSGLLDALADPAIDVEDCIVATDVPQLALLPAGTRTNSDTELLASARAKLLLERLVSANPDRILIFDTPPLLAASPASVLASHVGQVLLVVRADRTSERDLRDAVGLLDACEHVQLMLNAVTFRPGGQRFGSYYEASGQ